MAMKENSINTMKFLQANQDKDITAADVAEALRLSKKTIHGVFTALTRKGLGHRVPAEVELEDGTHKAIKLFELSPEGAAFDIAEEIKRGEMEAEIKAAGRNK